jgi:hypothetical protein
MPKFRKKPVVIEAFQWVPSPGVCPGLESDKHGIEYCIEEYRLQTPEGPFQVTPGDWIITGINGERYPCKPDIFALTYEPVEEGEAT